MSKKKPSCVVTLIRSMNIFRDACLFIEFSDQRWEIDSRIKTIEEFIQRTIRSSSSFEIIEYNSLEIHCTKYSDIDLNGSIDALRLQRTLKSFRGQNSDSLFCEHIIAIRKSYRVRSWEGWILFEITYLFRSVKVFLYDDARLEVFVLWCFCV